MDTQHHGTSHQQPSGLLDAPPKTTFVLGFLSGIVATVILGVIFLNPSFVQMGAKKTVAGTTDTVSNTNTTAAAAPTNDGATVGTFRAVSEKDDYIRGDKNAPVTLIEYSDLECPFCKQFHPTVNKILDEYKGKVKVVYRHFPLSSLHPKAPKEAEATECAAELGGEEAFWKYVDLVFERTPANNGLDAAKLPEFAKEIGLNESKFKTCLDSGKHAQKVQADYNDAVSAGGQGTPYSIIIDAKGNKTPVNGAYPYESVKAMIDTALQQS